MRIKTQFPAIMRQGIRKGIHYTRVQHLIFKTYCSDSGIITHGSHTNVRTVHTIRYKYLLPLTHPIVNMYNTLIVNEINNNKKNIFIVNHQTSFVHNNTIVIVHIYVTTRFLNEGMIFDLVFYFLNFLHPLKFNTSPICARVPVDTDVVMFFKRQHNQRFYTVFCACASLFHSELLHRYNRSVVFLRNYFLINLIINYFKLSRNV